LLNLALEKIAELEEKLSLNSKNSSKPPSSDQKPNTPENPPKKRKSRKGFSRTNYPPDRVDQSVECTRENCRHCGSRAIRDVGTPEAFQQAELPEVSAFVTEYLLHKYSCGDCGKKSIAELPAGVPDSAFGPRLMGLFATLTGVLHVVKREAVQLIKDLHDGDISLKQRNMRVSHRKRKVEHWLYDGFANGSDKLSSLCDILLDDFDKLWTFTKVKGMEPTNNLAERDLRKLVIWRKKSFGSRGQRFVERITSVIETVKRHSKNALQFVQEAVQSCYKGQSAHHISESLGI
jgi:hypothetical protein